LQRDLAEALRARGYFEARAKTAETELERARVANKEDARSLRELNAERQKILTKLRDRDHELREQRKLSAVCTLPPTPLEMIRRRGAGKLTGCCRTCRTR
ncbi:hypothetical protein IMZ48_41105, partial [Candidatus Bathyarchaeota archaeon]|nr:hypothetical protein [Candidatus Bathyarchaeota archaeon]